jgi:hypothetical protein
MLEILIYIIVGLFILVGVAGSILPGLPGSPLVFLGILIYAIYDKFENIGWKTLIILLLLTLFSALIDYISGVFGVKKYGGSKQTVWGSIIGGVLGLILFSFLGVFSFLGIIIGTFLGAFLTEIVFKENKPKPAFKIALGSLVGFIGGTVVNFFICITMVIIFLVLVFN